MNTLYLSAMDAATPSVAAEIIKSGELVAIPTETVYGLGADGLNPEAVAKIFIAKGRPQDNPLILHIADASDMEKLCHDIPQVAYTLAKKFWPGPLTMVLPAKDIVPACTTAGLPTVAVRCPDNGTTREIIRLAGVPIAAPSANISGKPSTTTAEHVLHDHDGRIAAIVDGGPCRVGVESTIIDLSDERPRLLRPGGVTAQQLAEVVGDLVIDKAITQSVSQDTVVKAPGMKYRHYAPECPVLVVTGEKNAAAQYIAQHFQPNNRVLCFEEELDTFADFNPIAYGKESDVDSLMAGLFAALRELDDASIGQIFARRPTGDGKAMAVQNRLMKAAGFSSVNAEEAMPPLCKRRCPAGAEGLSQSPSHAYGTTAPFHVIGITGGTGCGKTTLLQLLEEHGYTVLDCDVIYHRLLQTDNNMLEAISARFPGVIADGILDRKKLGSIVFADPAALQDLNAITHNAVKAEVLRQMAAVHTPVAIDAIGLFEGGLAELCDLTVAVTAPEELRIARLMARDGISEDYARARIAAQRPQSEFATLCDEVLVNDGSKADFHQKCLVFFRNKGIITV